MKVCIFFNFVKDDGMGDFSHFVDIYGTLKNNPITADYLMVPIIISLHSREIFEKTMAELGITVYFIAEPEGKLYENPEVQKYLRQAVQTIQISIDMFPYINEFKKYLNESVVNKYIGEHDIIDPMFIDKKTQDFSMGLSDRFRGIKLKELHFPQGMLAVLEKHDRNFLDRLLSHTHCSVEDFHEKYHLIPSYFTKVSAFLRLILLLASNRSLVGQKNIAIFLSGCPGRIKNALEDNYSQESSELLFYETSDVSRVELIGPLETDSSTFRLNPKGTRVIKIFYKFKLNDISYNSIYEKNLIAGVSGDNTLEKSISAKTLPFYWSSNPENKKPSLKALQKIVAQQLTRLGASDKLKEDFDFYFNYDNFGKFVTFSRNLQYNHDMIMQFLQLNLTEMIKIWPEIASVIIKEHNFYDHLEEIFLKGMERPPSLSEALKLTVWSEPTTDSKSKDVVQDAVAPGIKKTP